MERALINEVGPSSSVGMAISISEVPVTVTIGGPSTNDVQLRIDLGPIGGNSHLAVQRLFTAAWNILGLNDTDKQREVRNLILVRKISCLGLLETKVEESNKLWICHAINPNWVFMDNLDMSSGGCTIVG